MHKVLLIEDSEEIFQMVRQTLGVYIELDWADTIESAKNLLVKSKYDLFLLDVELPDGNGIDFCSFLQVNYPESLVFMLTVHAELSQKVMGFSVGADDYITKPFSPLELKTRVESRLKKLDNFKNSSQHLKWKELEIYKDRQEVYILDKINAPIKVDLTALEFKLLMCFIRNPYVVIKRDKLLDEVWGQNVYVYSRSVDTHVSKLRKKLGKSANIIQSIHGVGYKFIPTEETPFVEYDLTL